MPGSEVPLDSSESCSVSVSSRYELEEARGVVDEEADFAGVPVFGVAGR